MNPYQPHTNVEYYWSTVCTHPLNITVTTILSIWEKTPPRIHWWASSFLDLCTRELTCNPCVHWLMCSSKSVVVLKPVSFEPTVSIVFEILRQRQWSSSTLGSHAAKIDSLGERKEFNYFTSNRYFWWRGERGTQKKKKRWETSSREQGCSCVCVSLWAGTRDRMKSVILIGRRIMWKLERFIWKWSSESPCSAMRPLLLILINESQSLS